MTFQVTVKDIKKRRSVFVDCDSALYLAMEKVAKRSNVSRPELARQMMRHCLGEMGELPAMKKGQSNA